jgi:CRISPR-associated endoribonuclease Cas6
MLITNKFDIAKSTFFLEAKEDINLPPYKGSALRGGFGIVFRSICCVNKTIEKCNKCMLKEKCAYAYIFETSPSKDSKFLKRISEIPRPFVIRPPLETKSTYKKGEFLEFDLILIGKSIDYLPYFVFTFKELGRVGIGRWRAKFELDKIYNFYKEKIYDAEDDILKNRNLRIDIKEIIKSFSPTYNSLSLNFLTPTRIKLKGDLIVKPEFHVIIRALLHRLSALFYFHHGEELEIDYKKLISGAEEIRIKESKMKWIDWERYSSRQNLRMKLGGFVGKITYQGNLEPFLPFLLLGQYTHIGKNCTFGLGRYEVIKEEGNG